MVEVAHAILKQEWSLDLIIISKLRIHGIKRRSVRITYGSSMNLNIDGSFAISLGDNRWGLRLSIQSILSMKVRHLWKTKKWRNLVRNVRKLTRSVAMILSITTMIRRWRTLDDEDLDSDDLGDDIDVDLEDDVDEEDEIDAARQTKDRCWRRLSRRRQV